MNASDPRYHVNVYRFDHEKWTFDHVLNGIETERFAGAALIANGYNSAVLSDPDWMRMAVAEEVKE